MFGCGSRHPSIQCAPYYPGDRMSRRTRNRLPARRPLRPKVYRGSIRLVTIPKVEKIYLPISTPLFTRTGGQRRVNFLHRYLDDFDPIYLPLHANIGGAFRPRPRGRPRRQLVFASKILPWSDWRASAPDRPGELLLGVSLVPEKPRTGAARIKASRMEFAFVTEDGGVRLEYGDRLDSFPIFRVQQPKRRTVLGRKRHRRLARACMGRSGKAALDYGGFKDVPGNIFSIRQRAWAYGEVSAAVASDLPARSFAFATIAVAVVDDLNSPEWSSDWQARTMGETRRTVADALSSGGATFAYVAGFWEIEEKAFPNPKVSHQAFLNAAWTLKRPVAVTRLRRLFVIHLHLTVFAHNGSAWLSKLQIEHVLKKVFRLPAQVMVTADSFRDAVTNSVGTANYSAKVPGSFSPALIEQDALFRSRVTAAEMWPEGWIALGRDRPSLPVLRCMVRRSRRIDQLTQLGAAGPFTEGLQRWGSAPTANTTSSTVQPPRHHSRRFWRSWITTVFSAIRNLMLKATRVLQNYNK